MHDFLYMEYVEELIMSCIKKMLSIKLKILETYCFYNGRIEIEICKYYI